MKNYHHPNVLPLHCSFVTGQDLWMVMPYISGGSVLHIMKYAYPEVKGEKFACQGAEQERARHALQHKQKFARRALALCTHSCAQL
jgi:serine/threonine protein kinase